MCNTRNHQHSNNTNKDRKFQQQWYLESTCVVAETEGVHSVQTLERQESDKVFLLDAATYHTRILQKSCMTFFRERDIAFSQHHSVVAQYRHHRQHSYDQILYLKLSYSQRSTIGLAVKGISTAALLNRMTCTLRNSRYCLLFAAGTMQLQDRYHLPVDNGMRIF